MALAEVVGVGVLARPATPEERALLEEITEEAVRVVAVASEPLILVCALREI